ncbi:MAG: HAMP domain-containing protein [Gammaproteobacteria bacterium]|nr:HAMP domain-containing protein [Gammaproteobacteria bacterium]
MSNDTEAVQVKIHLALVLHAAGAILFVNFVVYRGLALQGYAALAAGVVLGALIVAISGWIYARRLVKPIHALALQVRTVMEQREFSRPLRPGAAGELGGLIAAINHLLAIHQATLREAGQLSAQLEHASGCRFNSGIGAHYCQGQRHGARRCAGHCECDVFHRQTGIGDRCIGADRGKHGGRQ